MISENIVRSIIGNWHNSKFCIESRDFELSSSNILLLALTQNRLLASSFCIEVIPKSSNSWNTVNSENRDTSIICNWHNFDFALNLEISNWAVIIYYYCKWLKIELLPAVFELEWVRKALWSKFHICGYVKLRFWSLF